MPWRHSNSGPGGGVEESWRAFAGSTGRLQARCRRLGGDDNGPNSPPSLEPHLVADVRAVVGFLRNRLFFR